MLECLSLKSLKKVLKAWTPGVVVQGEGSSEGDPCPLDVDVHGQVEQLGVPVPHLVLAEQQPDQLLRGRLVGHAQGLVLNVRPVDSVMKLFRAVILAE